MMAIIIIIIFIIILNAVRISNLTFAVHLFSNLCLFATFSSPSFGNETLRLIITCNERSTTIRKKSDSVFQYSVHT